ncbi:MAG: methyltransferase domain-containing protein [Bdellovibrionales bacterium]|nr:methyltransferase domain-containing protein [Bdellovibrionales bacterium]
MNLPNHGEAKGEWDIRGREQEYLGSLNVKGKSVFEIGTASGHLGFWMEQQGATVTSFDLSHEQSWDIIPYAGVDIESIVKTRKEHIRRLNNSWWYAHQKFNSKAKMVYGSVYEIDQSLGSFDVVTLNNMLLHVRDPFLAIQKAASICKNEIVITELNEPFFFWNQEKVDSPNNQCFQQFLPRAAKKEPFETWWFLPVPMLKEILNILGFNKIDMNTHIQVFENGKEFKFNTLVGRR